MKNATNSIIGTLSQRGYRITDARKNIIDALVGMCEPVTIQELVGKVSSDEASVYRTMELLVKEGLAEEIVIQDDRPHYALAHGHHHHLVCRGCGLIVHLPCDYEPLTPKNVTQFACIDTHEVTFYGTCVGCA